MLAYFPRDREKSFLTLKSKFRVIQPLLMNKLECLYPTGFKMSHKFTMYINRDKEKDFLNFEFRILCHTAFIDE